MVLTNHFSPTGHPWPVGPNDESSTYVLDSRLAIPGQKLAARFSTHCSSLNLALTDVQNLSRLQRRVIARLIGQDERPPRLTRPVR